MPLTAINQNLHLSNPLRGNKKPPNESRWLCDLVCKPGSVGDGYLSSLDVAAKLRLAPCHPRIYVGPTILIRCCFE